MSQQPPRVLVIASDTIGPNMAGSGVRYWNLARIIGGQQAVTLATPNVVEVEPPPGVTIVPYGAPASSEAERGRVLAGLIGEHDVVVAQHLPYLYTDPDVLASRFLAIDLYAPWILEKLEYARVDPQRGEPNRTDDVEILNRLLALGDLFLCASERQRDFWLGALASAGRLDLTRAQSEPNLRHLIDIVGFGLPEGKPAKTGPGPRELFEVIGPSDPLLLWNGGIWNWLDPLTAIRATVLLAEEYPAIRLLFMGTRSPGAQVAEMGVIEDARRLAGELGVLHSNVIFNEWVPYQERQNWLLSADATLSLNTRTIESRYSYRTRLLDNIWCGVPIVATSGDVLADLVQSEGIGLTVPPGDAVAVAGAIRQVLDRETGRSMRSRIATVSDRYTWERVSEPLLRFCREPWRLGGRTGKEPTAEYISKLERLYSETARYAGELERIVDEKNTALEREAARRSFPFIDGLLRRGRG